MQFFQELLKYIGGATVLVGAIAVLTKILVSHFLEKEKERFKKDLEQTAFAYQTRFSRLHDERAKVIASLYERICSALEATKEALYFKDDDAFKDRYKECADKALEETKGLRVFAQTNKIYFSDAVVERLDYFVNGLRHIAEVHGMEAMKAANPTIFFQVAKADEFLAATEERLSAILPFIEDDFKKLLGVDQ
jgi:hypothetical protein